MELKNRPACIMKDMAMDTAIISVPGIIMMIKSREAFGKDGYSETGIDNGWIFFNF